MQTWSILIKDEDIISVLKQIEDHIKDELKSRPEKKRDWRTYGCEEDKGCNKVARPFNT